MFEYLITWLYSKNMYIINMSMWSVLYMTVVSILSTLKIYCLWGIKGNFQSLWQVVCWILRQNLSRIRGLLRLTWWPGKKSLVSHMKSMWRIAYRSSSCLLAMWAKKLCTSITFPREEMVGCICAALLFPIKLWCLLSSFG